MRTYAGLATAMVGLAYLPLVFERVCALPGLPTQLVALMLGMLGCPLDAARRSAAMFFEMAVHFRAVLEEFEAQGGVRTLLNCLRSVCLLLRNAQLAELRLERQVAFHACHALRRYLRATLVLLVHELQARVSPARTQAAAAASRQHGQPASAQPWQLPPHKPVDIGTEAVDGCVAALEGDRRLADAFARCDWSALEAFLDQEGVAVLLELLLRKPLQDRCAARPGCCHGRLQSWQAGCGWPWLKAGRSSAQPRLGLSCSVGRSANMVLLWGRGTPRTSTQL
jgi:hypothetical protein